MDVVRGNQTLFMRKDEVEAAWSWIDPIISLIKENNRLPETYIPKSWGPTSSFDLLKRHGFEWCEPHFWRFNVDYARQIYEDLQPPISPEGVWNQSEIRPLEGFVFSVTPFNFTSIAGNLPSLSLIHI